MVHFYAIYSFFFLIMFQVLFLQNDQSDLRKKSFKLK